MNIDLGGAYLGGVNNYYLSHEFALEIIRRQKVGFFTNKEWTVIGKIAIHRLCWDEITTEYKTALSIFKKLDKLGFGEYLKKFKGAI